MKMQKMNKNKTKIGVGIKRKFEINRKKILFLFCIVVFLILFLLNFNILLSPKNEMSTVSRTIIFNWIGFSNSILIDDSSYFDSPFSINGKGFAIAELEPGTYFWKTESGLSIAKKFTIDSSIVIEKIENEDNTIIKNKGNVNVLLEVFDNFGLIGHAILNLNEGINLSNVTETIVSENE